MLAPIGLFRRKSKEAGAGSDQGPGTEEQAVITHLPLSGEDYGTREEREAVHELEERIRAAVEAIGGDHDGDEFGGGEAVLFTYGPNADALLEAIRAGLEGFAVKPGAYAVKRYGSAADPNSREERVELA